MPIRVLSTSTFYNKNTIDSTGVLWFSGGRIATFSTSFKNAGRQVFDMLGSKATLTVRDGMYFPFWNEPFEFPDNVKTSKDSKKSKSRKRKSEDSYDVELQTRYFIVDENGNEKEHLVGACVQVNEMIHDFVDGVNLLNDKKNLPQLQQGSSGKASNNFSKWEEMTVKTQQVLDALVQSSEQHSTISIA